LPEQERIDPLAPKNEDLRTQAMWKGLRKKFADKENAEQFHELEEVLVDDPFSEGMFVESFDPGL
jgi:hypothetical protein